MGKKILICCNAYPPNFIGGAELIAHAHAKQLQSFGNNVVIFTGDTREQGKRHSLRREDYEGLPVYRIRLTYEDYDPKYVNFIHNDVEEYFKFILKKFSPDIIHFHNLIGLSVGLIHIAKIQGIKTVLTLHDYWGFCFKNTLLKDNLICNDFTRCVECKEVISDENSRNIPIKMRQDFIAMQFEDIDAFISPSRYLAEAYVNAGIPKDKMHIIWNGVDIEKFSKIKKHPDTGHIRFTFIGYFGKHKGVRVLLDALSYLENKEKITLNLIGEGELLIPYEKEINKKNLNKTVKFWGKIKNIEDAFAETDVFILPSIWPENQPVSITEAMSVGIPVIASNNGGIPELIEDRKTGFLFKTGNSQDLARKMAEFIEKPGLIGIFGANALEKIQSNTLENQVKKIIELYDSLSEATKTEPNNAIVLCYGNRVDPECVEALKLLSKYNNSANCRFVMLDWLQKDQIKLCILFWMMDKSENKDAVITGLRNKLPLLVSEKNAELTDFCKKNNCGLYAKNGIEIYACLEFLINHDAERALMGKKGFEIFSRNYHL